MLLVRRVSRVQKDTKCTDFTGDFDTHKCYPLSDATQDRTQNSSFWATARNYKSSNCTGDWDPAKLGHDPTEYFSSEFNGICNTLFNTPDCTGPAIAGTKWSCAWMAHVEKFDITIVLECVGRKLGVGVWELRDGG